jgi:maltooligosyltrehalose trehalohydrolase
MDDYHHAIHAFLTGERQWYYADFDSASQLADVLQHPYVYDGKYSRFRDHTHGAPARGLAGDRFVIFLQNHDQVGNRPSGDRLSSLLSCPAKQRLAASYLLLSPYLPLLFMGEEFGEENPFPYFCSFQGEELVQAVREGRRRAHCSHDQDCEVPDPAAPATFDSARLTWSWPEGTGRARLRRLYRDLLTARRLWPPLRDFVNRSARVIEHPEGARLLELIRGNPNQAHSLDGLNPESVRPVDGIREQANHAEDVLIAYFNLEDRPQSLPAEVSPELTLRFSSEAVAYGGGRDLFGQISEVAAYECVVFGPSSWRSFP